MEASRHLAPVPVIAEPFEEWGRLTRFLESARMVFARELALLDSLGVDSPESVQLVSGSYRLTIARHRAAVEDAEMLHASVLIHSYAIVEASAATRMQADARDFGGVEDWGARFLRTNGRDWAALKDGLAGIVEVAVVRNALAHGSRTIDAAARTRLYAAGATAPPVGHRIVLDYGRLRQYRGRLLNLLNAGGVAEKRR